MLLFFFSSCCMVTHLPLFFCRRIDSVIWEVTAIHSPNPLVILILLSVVTPLIPSVDLLPTKNFKLTNAYSPSLLYISLTTKSSWRKKSDSWYANKIFIPQTFRSGSTHITEGLHGQETHPWVWQLRQWFFATTAEESEVYLFESYVVYYWDLVDGFEQADYATRGLVLYRSLRHYCEGFG